MKDVLTAAGQLALVSEFRLDYWRTKNDHRFFTVQRGRKLCDGMWAICDGGEFGACWNGETWSHECRGLDAYRYELEEALRIAKELALAENQHIIEVMEKRFPGDFRGGPFDLAAKGWT